MKRTLLKEAGAIFILAVLVLSSTAVFGQSVDTNNEATLTEISEPSSTVINNEPVTGRGPVLWNNGNPDGLNGLSCVYWPSQPLDRLVIDDFYVDEGGWEVGDGHFRIVTNSGFGPEAVVGVRVYFFYNTGPCEPTMEPDAYAEPTFTASLTGNTYFDRPEILVDCVFDPPVSLPYPGEWWVCFQPEMDDNCFWLTAATNDCTVLLDYPDVPHYRWTYGFDVFGDYYDVSFVLTGVGEPSIDVEKYVLDENNEWQDADTEDEAVDLEICSDVTFKIVVHNDGDEPLYNIQVKDKMHDSLKFISGDPDPDEYYYEEPDWYINWLIPGPLMPCETKELYIVAHVEGPECSYDSNYVLVESGGVRDDDWAWVHAVPPGSRIIKLPFFNWLQNHPHMFPILRVLLQRFAL